MPLICGMAINSCLSEAGYNDLLEASDGLAAVEAYDRENPDLVIMDITMPHMDGNRALEIICKKDRKANVIMCSALGQKSVVIDTIWLGAQDFIVKPFRPERILKAVRNIIG